MKLLQSMAALSCPNFDLPGKITEVESQEIPSTIRIVVARK